MIHECIHCNYITNRTNNFLKHIKTKKHKLNIEKNIEKNNKEDNITCDICCDIFNSKSSLYRHYKECKKYYELKKMEEIINKSVKTTANEMKTIFNRQIKELPTSHNVYNITNNNTVNNIILSYVDTDVSHLNNNDYKKIVNKVNFCVKMLVWKKHFNKDKPENMNLCINNKKDAYMKVFMKDKWTSRKIDEMIHTLFEENEMQIEEWLNEINDHQLNEKYLRYTKNKENNELREELKTDLKQFMYDMTKELGIGKTKKIITIE